MVTGSPQTKHKLFYACLNLYPNGNTGKDVGRKTKWIPTGLPERGNKRKAEQITDLLRPLFNRDGSLIDKYSRLGDPIDRIAFDLPELPLVTLTSLREMFGEMIKENNPDLEKAILLAEVAPTADQEHPDAIRKMLFCDYLVVFLERLAPTLERCTYGSYKLLVHGRIYEYFHSINVTVSEVLPGHIEAFYRRLATKLNLSQNTIKHYHTVIRKSLQQLYIKQTIPTNPADLITNRPERTIYQASFFDDEQINEYLSIVKGTKMELPVLFASFYGFRRSEVLGIKESAINFRTRQLLVRHTVTNANVDGVVELIKKDRTKNRFSLRSMPLVDTVETAINEANERQEHYRRVLGSSYNMADKQYLCLNEDGTLIRPDYITQQHKHLLEKHKFPHIRFHDLRHSCATMLLAKGVPLEKIKEWLGHSDIKMTERYAHMNVSLAKGEMADIMSGMIRL
jgi:integrase